MATSSASQGFGKSLTDGQLLSIRLGDYTKQCHYKHVLALFLSMTFPIYTSAYKIITPFMEGYAIPM